MKPCPKEADLFAAVSTASFERLSELLGHVASVNHPRDDAGRTLLHRASDGGRLAVVRLLLDRGANPNCCDTHGVVPLHLAARGGSLESVQALLGGGANPAAWDLQKRRPADWAKAAGHLSLADLLQSHSRDRAELAVRLNEACAVGDLSQVRALLDAGANPNASWPPDDWAPLHRAVLGGHEEVVQALLEHSADVNVHRGDDRTPLWLAAGREGPKLVARLLKAGAEPLLADHNFDLTPAEWAAQQGNAANLEVFLRREGQVGHLPELLWLAARWGRFRVVRVLLEHGCEVDPKSFCTAAGSGHPRVMKLLLRAGTRPGAPSLPLDEALKEAAKNNRRATMDLLLARGATCADPWSAAALGNVSSLLRFLDERPSLVTDDDAGGDTMTVSKLGRGPSLLGWSAWHGLHAAAGVLLAKGAPLDAFKAAALGLTAELHAMHRVAPDFLERKNQYGQTPLHWAAAAGNAEGARWLLRKGANVNARCNGRQTPLFRACASERLELMEVLVSWGASLHATDFRGQTPLHVAAEWGMRRVAEALVSSGADVNHPGGRHHSGASGARPLHAAVARREGNLVSWLLERGADPDAAMKDGRAPLHLAAMKGFVRAARSLLAANAHVNARDRRGRTPLDWATRQGGPQMAALLRLHGGIM